METRQLIYKCATPAQETILRRAAEVAHKSLTDFILDAAY
jgi:Protein of unknown function (DUF1778).